MYFHENGRSAAAGQHMAAIVQKAVKQGVLQAAQKVQAHLVMRHCAHGEVYALRLSSAQGKLRAIRSVGCALTGPTQAAAGLATRQPDCGKGLYTQAFPAVLDYTGTAEEYVHTQLAGKTQ